MKISADYRALAALCKCWKIKIWWWMRSFGRYQNNKYLLIEKSIPKLLASRHTQIARHLKIEMLLLSSLQQTKGRITTNTHYSVSQCLGNFKQNELGLIKEYGPGKPAWNAYIQRSIFEFPNVRWENEWYLTASLRCTQCFSDQLLKKADWIKLLCMCATAI